MRMMRAKKGDTQATLLFLLELVLPVMIGLILFSWVTDVTTDKLYTKQLNVRETSLLIGSLSAAPHNIWYEQTINKSQFTVTDKVTMRFKNDQQPVSHPYRMNSRQERKTDSPKESDKLFYTKTNEQFLINYVIQPSPSLYACTQNFVPKTTSLFINPITDQQDTASISQEIANQLAAALKITIRDIQVADPNNPTTVIPTTGATLGLVIKTDATTEKSVIVYYSLIQSNSFSCSIANALISAKLPAAIVGTTNDQSPINTTIFQREGRTAIIQATNLDQNELQLLVSAIAEGVKSYNDHS